ncbi:acylneuraminate cytidylyltransferase family protein [Candidatus Thioglobus sp.]|nr:acylneuraminate cytidylyltransferase family protein [Candidatus Thioglobus sp.]
MNIVAIIPARGGSKRLHGKNIKRLNGRPLISYTIDAALKCDSIVRVICSTDNEEIAEIAQNEGAEVPFLRPEYLSTDITKTPPVIEHAVSYIEIQEGKKVDVVVTLQPTSPLRESSHIEQSLKQFFKGKYDSLVSVRKGYPPWWMLKVEKGRAKPLLNLESSVNPFNLSRQQLPSAYEINGAIYITDRRFLQNNSSVISIENCGVFLMDQESSLDLDTMTDFLIIEEILKSKILNKE